MISLENRDERGHKPFGFELRLTPSTKGSPSLAAYAPRICRNEASMFEQMRERSDYGYRTTINEQDLNLGEEA
jgi:hypothetical protein